MAVCAVSAKSSRRLARLGGASSPAGQRYLDDLVPLAVYSSVAVCAASVERARRLDRGAADLGSDDESASESSGPPPPPSQRPPFGVGGPPPPPPLEEAASRPVAAAAPIPLVGASEIVWPSQLVEGVASSSRDERQAEALQSTSCLVLPRNRPGRLLISCNFSPLPHHISQEPLSRRLRLVLCAVAMVLGQGGATRGLHELEVVDDRRGITIRSKSIVEPINHARFGFVSTVGQDRVAAATELLPPGTRLALEDLQAREVLCLSVGVLCVLQCFGGSLWASLGPWRARPPRAL